MNGDVDSSAGLGDSIALAVGSSEAPAVRNELDCETNPTSHLLSINVTAINENRSKDAGAVGVPW